MVHIINININNNNNNCNNKIYTSTHNIYFMDNDYITMYIINNKHNNRY